MATKEQQLVSWIHQTEEFIRQGTEILGGLREKLNSLTNPVAEHSPLPWRLHPSDGWPGILDNNNNIVVFSGSGHEDDYGGIRGKSQEQVMANARLIIAGTSAIELLREILDEHEAGEEIDNPRLLDRHAQKAKQLLSSLNSSQTA